MAYENQEKCPRCGISIPKMPEDAAYEEKLCNGCHDEVKMKILEQTAVISPEDLTSLLEMLRFALDTYGHLDCIIARHLDISDEEMDRLKNVLNEYLNG